MVCMTQMYYNQLFLMAILLQNHAFLIGLYGFCFDFVGHFFLSFFLFFFFRGGGGGGGGEDGTRDIIINQ